MADKIFVNGMYFQKPREGAPDFVKGAISLKLVDFRKFLNMYAKGQEWLNIDLKKSKEGKLYFELNTYGMNKETPKQAPVKVIDPIEYPEEYINPDEIPF